MHLKAQPRGRTCAVLLLALAALAAPTAAAARALDLPVRDAAHRDTPSPAYFGDRLVVRLRPGAARQARAYAATSAPRAAVGVAGLDAAARRLGASLTAEFPAEAGAGNGSETLSQFWEVRLGAGVDLGLALDAFAALPEVAEASPVAICPVTAIPNDSLWSEEWHLLEPSRHDIHAPEAWDVSTGDPEIPIAIIDTGIIPYHPDLGGSTAGGWGNLWVNDAEANGLPGVDDDGNGYVDDVWGWDFVSLSDQYSALAGEDWRDPDNDPNDFAGHGTAVASICGALGDNGIGIAGALWHTRLMALRIGWASPNAPLGEVDMSAAAKAIRYATRNGAKVINCSFATLPQSDLQQALQEALRAGVIVVAAAGNNGSPAFINTTPEVISVGATDASDVVQPFSNRGNYVALEAPGYNLVSAIVKRPGTDSLGVRQPGYTAGASGTSFSSPQGAAGAALLQAVRRQRGLPPLTPFTAQMRLRETSDDISALNFGNQYGDGRLDLGRALTDPPTSFSTPVGATGAGAGVVLHSVRGFAWPVCPLSDGRLMVADPLTGDTLRSVSLGAPIVGSIAAADLGRGLGDALFVPLAGGRLLALDETLAPRRGWPVTIPPQGGAGGAQLALGDLDGDGAVEVVWGGVDGNVYAWRADGTRLPGFPRPVGAAGWPIPIALADLDGRPGLEILAALESGTVYALRADGSALDGWPVQTWTAPQAPVVMRVGGQPRVVVAAGQHIGSWSAAGVQLASRTLMGPASAPPAVGDTDGDGSPEVVIAEGTDLRVLDASLFSKAGTVIGDLTGISAAEPVIGPVLPGGALGVLAPLLLPPSAAGYTPGYVLLDATAATMSFTKPGRPGATPVLDELDGDGRTEAFTGAGLDSQLVVYDLGAGSWAPARAQWPTPRGNPARTGSRDGAPSLAPIDDAAPEAVADLAASAVDAHRATLRWSAPQDSGGSGRAARYDVRCARAPLDDGSWTTARRLAVAPTPDSATVAQSMPVDSLTENTTWYLALRSFDARGNASALSNVASLTTPGAPPGVVADLRVAAGNDTSVTLHWTADGDDGATGRPASYLVHASRQPLDAGSFDGAERAWTLDARADAGAAESRVLGGFAIGERWWFALRAVDSHGNLSPLSNVASALTGPLAARAGAALAVAGTPSASPVVLYWQGAPEALGQDQRVRVYDLTGRAVRSLAVGRAAAGVARWDGRDDAGVRLPPGLYFARLESGAFRGTARIVLVR